MREIIYRCDKCNRVIDLEVENEGMPQVRIEVKVDEIFHPHVARGENLWGSIFDDLTFCSRRCFKEWINLKLK